MFIIWLGLSASRLSPNVLPYQLFAYVATRRLTRLIASFGNNAAFPSAVFLPALDNERIVGILQ